VRENIFKGESTRYLAQGGSLPDTLSYQTDTTLSGGCFTLSCAQSR